MARRGSDLTVPTEQELDTTPKAITRRKNQAITATNQANAIAIQELEIAFDDDLRLAIIQGLVAKKQLILEESERERRVATALEIARLEAVENAREQGKQEARSQVALKKKQRKEEIQKQFIEVELPQLLDACDQLSYEVMKTTIDEFAARVGVKLKWEELEGGEFQCTPSIT